MERQFDSFTHVLQIQSKPAGFCIFGYKISVRIENVLPSISLLSKNLAKQTVMFGYAN